MQLLIEDYNGKLTYRLYLDEGSYIEATCYKQLARIIVDNYLTEYKSLGGNA